MDACPSGMWMIGFCALPKVVEESGECGTVRSSNTACSTTAGFAKSVLAINTRDHLSRPSGHGSAELPDHADSAARVIDSSLPLASRFVQVGGAHVDNCACSEFQQSLLEYYWSCLASTLVQGYHSTVRPRRAEGGAGLHMKPMVYPAGQSCTSMWTGEESLDVTVALPARARMCGAPGASCPTDHLGGGDAQHSSASLWRQWISGGGSV